MPIPFYFGEEVIARVGGEFTHVVEVQLPVGLADDLEVVTADSKRCSMADLDQLRDEQPRDRYG
jgi:hypothetical protein